MCVLSKIKIEIENDKVLRKNEFWEIIHSIDEDYNNDYFLKITSVPNIRLDEACFMDEYLTYDIKNMYLYMLKEKYPVHILVSRYEESIYIVVDKPRLRKEKITKLLEISKI